MRLGSVERFVGRQVQAALDKVFEAPEMQAAVQRGERLLAVAAIAREIARSELDDATACAQLRERLPADHEPAYDALERLATGRNSFVDDRAFRLLRAALYDTPVRPIDPALRGQFLAEERLGRQSLTDAFEQLAALEPRLRDKRTRRVIDPRARRSGWGISKTEILVGRWAESPHAILNTDLAETVVSMYRALDDAALGPGAGSSTPIFDREDDTEGFVRFLAEDPRPRATN